MSALGVVSDFVIGLVAEPVWQGAVLSLLLAETLLHQEGLVGTHLWLEILLLYIFIPCISHPTGKKTCRAPRDNGEIQRGMEDISDFCLGVGEEILLKTKQSLLSRIQG